MDSMRQFLSHAGRLSLSPRKIGKDLAAVPLKWKKEEGKSKKTEIWRHYLPWKLWVSIYIYLDLTGPGYRVGFRHAHVCAGASQRIRLLSHVHIGVPREESPDPERFLSFSWWKMLYSLLWDTFTTYCNRYWPFHTYVHTEKPLRCRPCPRDTECSPMIAYM